MKKWDQRRYEGTWASFPPARRAGDEAVLESIFALAEHSPLMQEALDWARAHDVKFLVDRKLAPGTAVGYYTANGVLALCASALDMPLAEVVATVTHEIRHAWQDYHGLLNAPAIDHAHLALATALTESDAEAFGIRAATEYRGWADEAQGAALLAENFKNWFRRPAMTHFYGEAVSVEYAWRHGLTPGAMPEAIAWQGELEYKHLLSGADYDSGTLDYRDLASVRRLGAGFDGKGNYFSELPRDFLVKTALRPSLARTFWGAAAPADLARTSAIRKADLKYARPAVARHPWP